MFTKIVHVIPGGTISQVYKAFPLFYCQKPEGWLDDEPTYIPDPNGVKPDDWDNEEDGEWEAPQIGRLLFFVFILYNSLDTITYLGPDFV